MPHSLGICAIFLPCIIIPKYFSRREGAVWLQNSFPLTSGPQGTPQPDSDYPGIREGSKLLFQITHHIENVCNAALSTAVSSVSLATRPGYRSCSSDVSHRGRITGVQASSVWVSIVLIVTKQPDYSDTVDGLYLPRRALCKVDATARQCPVAAG